MFCKNCGAYLDDDAQFCEKCGTEIKRIAQDTSQLSISEENTDIKDHTDLGASSTSKSEQDVIQPKKKHFSKTIVVAIVAAIAIIVALLIALGNNSGSKNSNLYQEVNFNNGAKFAYDGSRLYIIGLYNEDDEDTSLYSTDYKGVNKTLISDDSDINSIRLVDGKIYYKASGDDEYTIGVINMDGSGKSVIVTSSESLGRYDVYKETLYYIQDSTIHTCTLTGENDTALLESVDTFTLCNGYIYYVDNDDVIRSYCIKNAETKELCKSSGANYLSVDGNTLYFACDTGLSSVMVNGESTITKIIRDDSLYSYAFYDGYIYYNHQMTSDERDSIAEYAGDTSSEVLTYKLALIGTGSLYRANLAGGDGESVDSDQIVIYSLFNYPDGLYCRVTVWDDRLKHIELN